MAIKTYRDLLIIFISLIRCSVLVNKLPSLTHYLSILWNRIPLNEPYG